MKMYVCVDLCVCMHALMLVHVSSFGQFLDYDYSKTSLITGVSCCQQTSVDTSDDENLEDSFSK